MIEQTGLAGDFPVGLIGSAFKAGALFVEPLAAAIRRSPRKPGGGRGDGACRRLSLARRARWPAASGRWTPRELKSLLDAVLAREGVFRE